MAVGPAQEAASAPEATECICWELNYVADYVAHVSMPCVARKVAHHISETALAPSLHHFVQTRAGRYAQAHGHQQTFSPTVACPRSWHAPV